MPLLIRASLLAAIAALAIGLLVGAAADDHTDALTLPAGTNAVTWSGAEPYAISNFEGTPVTRIHRWDAVRQKWLSHAIGQDDATLPELHLLPRVQYLLLSDAKHELTIPNPLADIDPLAELRFPAAPDDPLRFTAYWPNEDSPLEDLVVLRGEDERLSVEAWVAGGEGEVSVWWAIDGRVNHSGLTSDDVELLPGGHDDGKLFAVDESGHVAVVGLPRVVRLPELELPEMLYGISAHLGRGDALWSLYGPFDHDWYTAEMLPDALEMIAHAGLELVRLNLTWNHLERTPDRVDQDVIERYRRLFQTVNARGLEIMSLIYNGVPQWANGCDGSQWPNGWRDCWTRPAVQIDEVQEWGRTAAALFPEIRYWQVGNEPNLRFFWTGMDPWLYTEHLKSISLGIWYENPDAVIISAGICCAGGSSTARRIEGGEFVEQLYEAGFGPYHDINAIHYPRNYQASKFLDRYLATMRRYGDGDKPLWATEMGNPWENNAEHQGSQIVEELTWLTERPEVRAAFIYNFWDHGTRESPPNSGLVLREYDDGFTPKASYWAVREFLTGQPPPNAAGP